MVGKFVEDIVLPYGEEEAAKRIGTWLGTEEAKGLRVSKKGPGYVKLYDSWGNIVTGKKSIWYELWIRPEGVHAECWVGGMVKTSIEPGVWGVLPRMKAWDRYLSLKKYLQIGTTTEARETLALNIERVKCTRCGAVYALDDDMIMEDGSIQCRNCKKPFTKE
jgi:hypothetical protein